MNLLTTARWKSSFPNTHRLFIYIYNFYGRSHFYKEIAPFKKEIEFKKGQ